MNPAAPLEGIRHYLPLLSKVTIMIVDAGYAGQKVITQMYDKIRTLVQWREEMGLDFLIEADGSMNAGVYAPLYEAGADMVFRTTALGIRSGDQQSRGNHGKGS